MKPLLNLFGGFVCAWMLIASVLLIQRSAVHSSTVPNVALEAPPAKLSAPKVVVAKPALCECGANCQCGQECACNDLPTIATKAAREGKPLLIWVGQTCVCERELSEFVHAHVKEYRGAYGTERDQKAIVGRPDGQGGMVVAARIVGCPADLPALVRRAIPQSQAVASTFEGGFVDAGLVGSNCGPGG